MYQVSVGGEKKGPTPTSQKEVQSFLGFTNFYRCFIKDFSLHTQPLFDLTKKGEAWKWGEAKESALQRLKDQITSAPILTFLDNARMYRVEAEASDFATGATLSQ